MTPVTVMGTAMVMVNVVVNRMSFTRTFMICGIFSWSESLATRRGRARLDYVKKL